MRQSTIGAVLDTFWGKTIIAATILQMIKWTVTKQTVKLLVIRYLMTRKFITFKVSKE